jgi:hypothetical protein
VCKVRTRLKKKHEKRGEAAKKTSISSHPAPCAISFSSGTQDRTGPSGVRHLSLAPVKYGRQYRQVKVRGCWKAEKSLSIDLPCTLLYCTDPYSLRHLRFSEIASSAAAPLDYQLPSFFTKHLFLYKIIRPSFHGRHVSWDQL